jgi:hypothetical protein
MLRREFIEIVTGAFLSPIGAPVYDPENCTRFRAISGANLPSSLLIPNKLCSDATPLWELREYRGNPRDLAALKSGFSGELFAINGLNCRSLEGSPGNLRLLFPFASLGDRAKKWDRLNVDPLWHALRERAADARLSSITIYSA